jgi:hypothetical protein
MHKTFYNELVTSQPVFRAVHGSATQDEMVELLLLTGGPLLCLYRPVKNPLV